MITRKGMRLPRRDCVHCEGSGFVPKEPKIGDRVIRCDCWRYVSFNRETHDGKQAATGEPSNDRGTDSSPSQLCVDAPLPMGADDESTPTKNAGAGPFADDRISANSLEAK